MNQSWNLPSPSRLVEAAVHRGASRGADRSRARRAAISSAVHGGDLAAHVRGDVGAVAARDALSVRAKVETAHVELISHDCKVGSGRTESKY